MPTGKMLAYILSVVIASGCKNENPKEKSAPNSKKITATTPGTAASEAGETSGSSALIGTWSTPCRREKDGLYSTRISTFDQSTDVMTATLFQDKTCRTVLYKAILTASYVSSKTVPQNLDFVVKSLKIKIYDKTYVDFYNKKRICGRSDWSNTSGSGGDDTSGMDVTSCPEFNIYAPSNRFYSIFSFDGTTLYFGETNVTEGKTEATRPTTFDKELPYTRSSL